MLDVLILHYQADAEDRGEDVERRKNWEWTVEENDAWEKKKKRKEGRADFEFHGASVQLVFQHPALMAFGRPC